VDPSPSACTTLPSGSGSASWTSTDPRPGASSRRLVCHHRQPDLAQRRLEDRGEAPAGEVPPDEAPPAVTRWRSPHVLHRAQAGARSSTATGSRQCRHGDSMPSDRNERLFAGATALVGPVRPDGPRSNGASPPRARGLAVRPRRGGRAQAGRLSAGVAGNGPPGTVTASGRTAPPAGTMEPVSGDSAGDAWLSSTEAAVLPAVRLITLDAFIDPGSSRRTTWARW